MRKWLGRSLIVVGSILIVGSAGAWGYYYAVKRAWIRYNEWDIRSEGTLVVGDLAPDIEFTSTDGTEKRRLSQLFAEKPVVLVFGSYT